MQLFLILAWKGGGEMLYITMQGHDLEVAGRGEQ
jgi:hypothetical protein